MHIDISDVKHYRGEANLKDACVDVWQIKLLPERNVYIIHIVNSLHFYVGVPTLGYSPHAKSFMCHQV